MEVYYASGRVKYSGTNDLRMMNMSDALLRIPLGLNWHLLLYCRGDESGKGRNDKEGGC